MEDRHTDHLSLSSWILRDACPCRNQKSKYFSLLLTSFSTIRQFAPPFSHSHWAKAAAASFARPLPVTILVPRPQIGSSPAWVANYPSDEKYLPLRRLLLWRPGPLIKTRARRGDALLKFNIRTEPLPAARVLMKRCKLL